MVTIAAQLEEHLEESQDSISNSIICVACSSIDYLVTQRHLLPRNPGPRITLCVSAKMQCKPIKQTFPEHGITTGSFDLHV